MAVFVVALDFEVEGAVGAWALANGLTAAFALVAAHRAWRPLGVPNVVDPVSRALARFAIAMGAVQVINLVSYRAELFVLRHYGSLREVGIYSIAMQAAEAMWLVAGAIATAVTAPAVHETEARAAQLIGGLRSARSSLTAVVAIVVGCSRRRFSSSCSSARISRTPSSRSGCCSRASSPMRRSRCSSSTCPCAAAGRG